MTAPAYAASPRVPMPTEVPWTLEALGRPALALVVYGVPAPQGSKSATVRGGRAVMYEDNPRTGVWRQVVAAAARGALPVGWEPLDGPLVMDLILTMPRPLGLPKTLRRLPHVKPDLSKLARAVEDSLATDTDALRDDARIVTYRRLEKLYERDHDSDALRQPGAVIRVWPVPPTHLGKAPLG